MQATQQIRGNCQCCGRQQAVVNGRMSKHGYTVKEGWFSGICSGRNYAPIQVSRTTTDKIIADISAEIPELIAKAEKVKSGELTPKTLKVRMMSKEEIKKLADRTKKAMEKAAKELDFMEAAKLRDELKALQALI